MSYFSSPYPTWDVLSKWDSVSYNDQTREVLRERLSPPPRRALTERQFAVLEALCERVIPQAGDPETAPIAALIDSDIFTERPTGTRYEGMPDNPTAWRTGLDALDAEAKARGGEGFVELKDFMQDAVLKNIDNGDVQASDAWQGISPQRFFRHTALKQIVQIYYADPKGQSEIGFGGPASPRGYVRLDSDRLDEWEAPRGEWRDAKAMAS